jgi:hypothetical protein
MNEPLTLQEALRQSTSTPRRATAVQDGVLYFVELVPGGDHRITTRRLGAHAAAEDTAEAAPPPPEYGWVPGASTRVVEPSPAYWNVPPDAPAN